MIWLKLLIFTILITAFLVTALALKLFFDKNAKFSGASCHLDENEESESSACSSCEVKEIINCKEEQALSH